MKALGRTTGWLYDCITVILATVAVEEWELVDMDLGEKIFGLNLYNLTKLGKVFSPQINLVLVSFISLKVVI